MNRAGTAYTVLLGLAAMGIVLASPRPAAALSTSLTVGPLPIPDVPIEVCVDSACITTPDLSSATVSVSVQANGLVLPVITAGLCPAGQVGVVLTISSLLPGNLTIGGQISAELVDGSPITIPIGPVPVGLGIGETTTLSLCTSD